MVGHKNHSLCDAFLVFLRATAGTAIARLSHRNYVRPSVTRVDQAKTVQARIIKSFTIGCPQDSSFRICNALPKIP